MFVQNRSIREVLQIGDVLVVVLSIDGSRVRLGFKSPDNVHICASGESDPPEVHEGLITFWRRPRESITIGELIKVTIAGVGSSRARIGIEAPNNVRITRWNRLYNPAS